MEGTTYDIIAIGSATQDVFLTSDHFRVVKDANFDTGSGMCVPQGSKVEISKLVVASGGGATNAAVTLARQGLRTACVAVVGDDTNGRLVLDELRRENVDGKYMQMHHGTATGYSVILVGASGERTILSYKGEGSRWEVERIPWDRLQAKWLYVGSLGGHLEMLDHIAAWQARTGGHVATNPGLRELDAGLEKLMPFWKKFDIVGFNQEEAAQVTGISYDRENELFTKMDELINGICIMTKGADGVVVSDGQHLYRAGIPTQEIVERTGAGDAFHAGFVAEFMRSGNIEKAIQLATANATSVVMQYGAKAGILTRGHTGPWPLVQVKREALV